MGRSALGAAAVVEIFPDPGVESLGLVDQNSLVEDHMEDSLDPAQKHQEVGHNLDQIDRVEEEEDNSHHSLVEGSSDEVEREIHHESKEDLELDLDWSVVVPDGLNSMETAVSMIEDQFPEVIALIEAFAQKEGNGNIHMVCALRTGLCFSSEMIRH